MFRSNLMQIRKYLLIILCAITGSSYAQVTGGQRTMEFLRLANSPHISALGGTNIASADDDIAFALQNPALMRPELHNNLGLNYNAFYSGISIANMQYGYHVPKINTSFALGIQYLNYGSFTQTDNIGNQYGTFKANEFAITLAASRQYKTKWRYGAALKFANSALYDKRSSALLMDIGVTYYDSNALWMVSAVAQNMGVVLSKYNPNNSSEPLPFDLQIGISKRLKYVPLRLMATIHHLYEWDIRYNNPADNTQNNLFGGQDTTATQKSYFGDKLFRHFVFGAEIIIGKRLLATVAYNHLRRGELSIEDKPGLAGFSFGLGVNLNKFQIHYARSYYHIAGAYNEFGINMSLNKIIGAGKLGEKINWSDTYPGWKYTAPPRTSPTSASSEG
ncbi:MAG: type IX secretion system protein PorQ [Flavipsychrobacter sp.]